MASPRKFSEKIALLNQKQAEETARFEQIMKEVSDVTNRAATTSSSVNVSPTGSTSAGGVRVVGGGGGGGGGGCRSGAETSGGRPLSVKSAGASPPQSSGKHLHISLGNQFRAGGSLPNVNATNNVNVVAGQEALVVPISTSAVLHPIDLQTALSNLEEVSQNQGYRQTNTGIGSGGGGGGGGDGGGGAHERSRSIGGGPMRSRPLEKRHDTSPYSGVPYLSPPLPETWRRTNSDSALHQSANEACQTTSSMGHRRGSDAYHRGHGGLSTDNSHHQHCIERPRSSCKMPRVPGINVYPSSQPPGQQIPISNNTGSLPDLSNVHFPSPIHTPIDQEDHSSGSQYSNSQTSSPTTLSPTSLAQAGRQSFTQEHSPPSAQNHLSVPVNHRYLHSCKQGLTLDGNTSASQQDVRIGYAQQSQPPTGVGPPQSQPQPVPGSNSSRVQQTHQVAHSPVQYVYQQPHSPVAAQSPNSSQAQVHQPNTLSQFNSLNYRTPQMVNRPSPQSSPSLTYQGSPLSYSNNPSTPSSPTGHHGAPNLSLDPQDQNVFINQVHADFEQFSMDWAQVMPLLEDTGYSLNTQLDEMDSPSTTIGTYINSPSHTGTYTQSDVLNVANDLGSSDTSYFGTSPLQQLGYQTRTPTTTQQLTPQTPNTPTITLTDCSLGPDDLVGSDFGKDFSTSMTTNYVQDLFPADDPLAHDLNLRQEDINALRQGLDPLDLDELQRLANADMVISDPTTEANFRLEQR